LRLRFLARIWPIRETEINQTHLNEWCKVVKVDIGRSWLQPANGLIRR
jgi:hypothetical protein